MADVIWKEEVNAHVKCKTVLEDNLQKACSLVLGQCTKSLESKLKAAKQLGDCVCSPGCAGSFDNDQDHQLQI